MTPSAPVLAPPPQLVPFVPDPSADLPASAEVVVVGGGMLGASAAYQLARAGMRPLVIEANSPAWGASGRNAGMALAGLGDHFERVTGLVQDSGMESSGIGSAHSSSPPMRTRRSASAERRGSRPARAWRFASSPTPSSTTSRRGSHRAPFAPRSGRPRMPVSIHSASASHCSTRFAPPAGPS
jgi:choline dehydrogenase-like flavoprotein